MGSSLNNDDDIITGINVTPLVDVVLVLLIIFMITAPTIYSSALKVQLPKANSAESIEKTALTFSITKDGQVGLDGKPLAWDQVKQTLSTLSDIDQKTAVINADKETPHGTVIQLIDLLKQAGLVHFAMSVDSHKN
ncbi:MAG: biopolymer transporter ExbD [Deltaproteobacteria bacterium]|nr:MAG: biopolymer transporter ExbD [Deltaproteobacteria bacterium]